MEILGIIVTNHGRTGFSKAAKEHNYDKKTTVIRRVVIFILEQQQKNTVKKPKHTVEAIQIQNYKYIYNCGWRYQQNNQRHYQRKQERY